MRRLIKKGKLPALTLVWLYYYGKLIGLCPFVLDMKGIKCSRCGLLHSIILSLIYLIIFIQGMIKRKSFSSPNETILYVICDKLVVIIQFSMVIVSWLVFGFRQKKLEKMLKDFRKISLIAKDLGIVKDNWKIMKPLPFYILFLNFCYLFLFSATLLTFSNFPTYDVLMWGPFFFPHVVFHNVLGLFIIAMQIMQWWFHRLNLQLRNLPARLMNNVSISRNLEFNRSSKKVLASIDNFGELHSSFVTLTKEIIDFFSPPVLMALIAGLLQTVSNVYSIYLYDKNYETWKRREILVNIIVLCWFLIILTEMFMVSSISASVSEEANETGIILHKMRLDYKSYCNNTIRRISVKLFQKQLNISIHGFINLDFQFIFSFCTTTTTYLIILLQLGSSTFK